MATKALNGGSYTKISLSGIEPGERLNATGIALLLGLGAAAVVLHEAFHWPLHLPGHHGIEWMALLVFARCTSRHPWAASIASLGAATLAVLPIWGPGADLLQPLVYFVPGLMVDGLWCLGGGLRENPAYLACAAALAHASRPLLQLLAFQATGIPHHSLAQGLAYPLVLHLGFGLAGGLVGAMLWKATARRQRR